MATVDILLPVKNTAKYLRASLDSLLTQNFQDWRLKVLDHGSADGSLAIAESYAESDARVVVHSFPDAVGLSGLLNKGLETCDCKYVLRHDADDVAFPNRIDISVAAFEANSSIAAVGGQAILIDEQGGNIGRINRPTDKDRISAGCFFWNPIIHPTVMMDFKQLQRVGARYGIDFLNATGPGESIDVANLAEDYFLFGQLALLGKCINVPNDLIKYRKHQDSVGVTRFREQMEISLNVSRFLMRSFCRLHKIPYVDPAPFCNHGGTLFDVDRRTNFKSEFQKLALALRNGFGESDGLERELSYRHSISTRTSYKLLACHVAFSSNRQAEQDERNAVREWMIGRLRGRARLRVPPNID